MREARPLAFGACAGGTSHPSVPRRRPGPSLEGRRTVSQPFAQLGPGLRRGTAGDVRRPVHASWHPSRACIDRRCRGSPVGARRIGARYLAPFRSPAEAGAQSGQPSSGIATVRPTRPRPPPGNCGGCSPSCSHKAGIRPARVLGGDKDAHPAAVCACAPGASHPSAPRRRPGPSREGRRTVSQPFAQLGPGLRRGTCGEVVVVRSPTPSAQAGIRPRAALSPRA